MKGYGEKWTLPLVDVGDASGDKLLQLPIELLDGHPLMPLESAALVGRELGATYMPPILVVDLEATCDEYVPSFDMETIEIGAVWIAANGTVLDRFQSIVRPVVNPMLTPSACS